MSDIEEIAARNGGQLELYEDPYQAVKGADVVYTDTWISMGQEAESAPRIAAMQPYQVNSRLIDYTGKDTVVLHCLPAHRGQEITDDVADGANSLIFPQAENRLHAQKAILVELLG
jgi:ornithine carbamoyltransferase